MEEPTICYQDDVCSIFSSSSHRWSNHVTPSHPRLFGASEYLEPFIFCFFQLALFLAVCKPGSFVCELGCFALLSLFVASLTHYKLYLVSKVAAKINGDDDLEPENFRGEGGAQTSKKKKTRCLNFSENEFEVTAEESVRESCLNVVVLMFWLVGRSFHACSYKKVDTVATFSVV